VRFGVGGNAAQMPTEGKLHGMTDLAAAVLHRQTSRESLNIALSATCGEAGVASYWHL
jgi:hypothetical protein